MACQVVGVKVEPSAKTKVVWWVVRLALQFPASMVVKLVHLMVEKRVDL